MSGGHIQSQPARCTGRDRGHRCCLAEPHFGFRESILIALVFLGVPLLSLVGIIGALVSWRRGHGRAAVVFAALAIGCAWLTISAMPGVGLMSRLLLKIPLLLLVGIVGTRVLRRRGHRRAAVAFVALAIGCAWLTVSSLGGIELASVRHPAPAPVVADEAPITLSGGQEERRRPFELRNGRYTVRWTAMVRPSEPSCRLRVSLRRAGDNSSVAIIDRTLDPQGMTPASDDGSPRTVTPGLHELAVHEDSGCDWSLTLAPGWPTPTPPPVR